MQIAKKELHSLNALKFVCAIMVVAIHIPCALPPLLFPIYRIAVPIFFIISGYFLLKWEGEIRSETITLTIIKIFTITLIANIAYYLFYAFFPPRQFSYPVIDLILIGDAISGPLWYLNAYLEVLCILWIIIKAKIDIKWIFVFIPIGLALNLFLGSYYWLFWESWLSFGKQQVNDLAVHRNFLTIGLPSVAIGIYIKLHEKKLSLNCLLILIVCLATALYIEYALIKFASPMHRVDGDITLFTVPLAVAVFLFALNYNQEHNWLFAMSRMGKRHSLNIYLYHKMVAYVIGVVLWRVSFVLSLFCILPLTIIAICIIGAVWMKFKESILAKVRQLLPMRLLKL